MSHFTNTLKTSRIINIALIAGVLAFAGIAVYLHEGKVVWNGEDIIFQVALLVAFGSVAASFILFKQFLKKAAQASTTEEKLNQYTAAKIIQWALLEGSALFGGVVVLITQNGFALILTLAMVALLLITAPSEAKMRHELDL